MEENERPVNRPPGSYRIRSDAGADGPQQERWKVRVIGGLGLDFALGAPGFGTTDRGHARGLCWSGWREAGRRSLRLLATGAAGALCVSWFAFAAPGRTRLALAALVAAIGGARLAFTPRLASAARTFPRTVA
jgi:hypothetical protein